MRKRNVSKEVDALAEFTNRHFHWMEGESSLTPKPLFDERKQPVQLAHGVCKNHSVVRISDIIRNPKLVFDKMIECIQIHIRKQLTG